MNPAALLATIRLKFADRALARYDQRAARAGITWETTTFRRLNRRVDAALSNPHLPARYRDPADTNYPPGNPG